MLAPSRKEDTGQVEAGILLLQRRLHLSQVYVELSKCGGEVVAVQHDLAGETLADLYLAVEHARVVVQLCQCCDGHDLRDRAEQEQRLSLQGSHVLDHEGQVLHRIANHRVQTLKRGLDVLGVLEAVEVVGEVAPDLLGPEDARGVLRNVLEIVTDDVRLLQEQTHVIGRGQVIGKMGVLHAAGGEQASEAVSDEAGDVVAVHVVVVLRLDGVLEVVAHAVGHALADVRDHLLVGRLQLLVLTGNTVVLLKEQFLMSLADAVDAPGQVVGLLVEDGQLLLLLGNRHVHVILNRIKGTQDEVEDADCIAHLLVELHNDRGEGAADLVEDFVTKLQVFLIVTEVQLQAAPLALDGDHREDFIDTE